jgi:hypothetical protein
MASGFFRRLMFAPFEVLIGGLAITTAIAGLLETGSPAASALDAVLPGWAANLFQIAYLVAGVCLVVGVGAQRSDIESAGLVVIATNQVVRAIVFAALIGVANAAVSMVFAALVTVACWARLWGLAAATKQRQRQLP